ncbi:MAG: metal ABC transporter ATP-binding protein [bacterium]|nr:metal ABC transporter ATP-binding protein [bacterium]
MEGNKILEVSDLSVSFDGLNVLENLNFNVEKGSSLAVIGPNGAGKSVLFRALLGLIPYKGTIDWSPGIKISYVPQRLEIERTMPLTVLEFLKLKTENFEEIKEVLEVAGIKTGPDHEYHLEQHVLNRKIGLVSGGEFQRILIAWALIGSPDVLLFDEPTSGIDVGGEQTIYNLLTKLRQEKGMTIILVSHDLNIVYKYAGMVLCINKASAVCFGHPETVLKPEDLTALYGGEAEFYKHNH